MELFKLIVIRGNVGIGGTGGTGAFLGVASLIVRTGVSLTLIRIVGDVAVRLGVSGATNVPRSLYMFESVLSAVRIDIGLCYSKRGDILTVSGENDK
jgi:hypothetical protein